MTIHYELPNVGYVLVWSIIIGAILLILTPVRFKGYATMAVLCGIGAVLWTLNSTDFVEWGQCAALRLLSEAVGIENTMSLTQLCLPFGFSYGLLIGVGFTGAMCGILIVQVAVWVLRRRKEMSKHTA
jgi:hypothetical protein